MVDWLIFIVHWFGTWRLRGVGGTGEGFYGPSTSFSPPSEADRSSWPAPRSPQPAPLSMIVFGFLNDTPIILPHLILATTPWRETCWCYYLHCIGGNWVFTRPGLMLVRNGANTRAPSFLNTSTDFIFFIILWCRRKPKINYQNLSKAFSSKSLKYLKHLQNFEL